MNEFIPGLTFNISLVNKSFDYYSSSNVNGNSRGSYPAWYPPQRYHQEQKLSPVSLNKYKLKKNLDNIAKQGENGVLREA